MSTLKSVLVTIAGVAIAVGGLAGILLATGVIENTATAPEVEGAPVSAREARVSAEKQGRELASLGYIGAVEIREEDRAKVGVTKHLEGRVRPALSVYNPCAWGTQFREAAGGQIFREARLIDRRGEVLHEWKSDFASDSTRGWAIAKLSGDGHLYAINARAGIVKLDWDSKEVWSRKDIVHHDMAFAPDGRVWVLTERRREVIHDGVKVPILDNGVAVLSPDGVVEREIWFYDQLEGNPLVKRSLGRAAKRLRKQRRDGKPVKDVDLIHANTADFATVAVDGLWQVGDFVTALRELDSVAVFNRETGALEWMWGSGTLEMPHDPSQLASGNLLIFDNGTRRKWSRVVEINPKADDELVWEYRGSRAAPFFSSMRGLAQRLDDDHVLITDSQTGRVIEVDRDGEILWEFWSPYVLKGSLRVPIRMIQLEGDALAFAQRKLGLAAAPAEP